jgi:hypothetical protein
MNTQRNKTTFCGISCNDCIPGNKELFSTIRKLEKILKNIGFEKYASFKAQKSNIFNEYNIFDQVLNEIRRLECSGSCYEGPESELGCNSNCEIRKCVLEKDLDGCWDCEQSNVCEKLSDMKKFHPSITQNLEAIKEHGIENWFDHRGKHYEWS